MLVWNKTHIFIFIHIDIAHITFVIFVVCIISAAFATILSHYNSPFLNLIIEFLHYCIIFFIMICFPSIIAYFLVLYEKKSINIAITGCPRFVIHAIFYVIFLSKGGMIDIRKNILSKSFAAQFHKKIPRVYKVFVCRNTSGKSFWK